MPNGNWKSKIVESLEMAKKVDAKYKTEAVEQDVFNIHHAPSLLDAWSQYLEWAKLNKRSWKDDETRWRKHIQPYLKNRKMDQVTPHDIQKIISNLSTTKTTSGSTYKPATIKQVVTLIKRVYNWSINREYYHGPNPGKNVDIPYFDNRVTNLLNKKDLKTLLKALDCWENERTVLVIKFALYSGKRKGEILKLTWDKVDLENGFITLAASNTKNKETQVVPVNQSCMDALRRAYEIRLSELVFPSSTGKFYYNTFNANWKLFKKRAGIDIRFHDLRHTYASYLASSGKVDIYTLKELLGHKTINMTQRYAHLMNGTLRSATGVADKVFK